MSIIDTQEMYTYIKTDYTYIINISRLHIWLQELKIKQSILKK